MSKKEQVSAHIKPSTGTAVQSYERTSNRDPKRGLSARVSEAREHVANALTDMSADEDSFSYPVDNFSNLPQSFQMATIATIADVPLDPIVSKASRQYGDYEGIPVVTGEKGREVIERMNPRFDTAEVAEKLPNPQEYQDGIDKWATKARNFLKENKGYIHGEWDNSSDIHMQGYGYPSKNGWEATFRVLTVADSLGAHDATKLSLAQACVGDEAGSAFWEHQKKQ